MHRIITLFAVCWLGLVGLVSAGNMYGYYFPPNLDQSEISNPGSPYVRGSNPVCGGLSWHDIEGHSSGFAIVIPCTADGFFYLPATVSTVYDAYPVPCSDIVRWRYYLWCSWRAAAYPAIFPPGVDLSSPLPADCVAWLNVNGGAIGSHLPLSMPAGTDGVIFPVDPNAPPDDPPPDDPAAPITKDDLGELLGTPSGYMASGIPAGHVAIPAVPDGVAFQPPVFGNAPMGQGIDLPNFSSYGVYDPAGAHVDFFSDFEGAGAFGQSFTLARTLTRLLLSLVIMWRFILIIFPRLT